MTYLLDTNVCIRFLNQPETAAIAVANDCTLVTHNSAEFSRIVNLLLEDREN